MNTTEAGIIGALLDANGSLPPNVSLLLANAPESFDDPRHQQIAVVVRKLRGEGQPADAAAIAPRLHFDDSTIYLMSLGSEALPLDLAEVEAETVWRAYQERRAKSVLNDALRELESAPSQAATIIRGAVDALGSLTATNSNTGWGSLVEDGADAVTQDLPPLVEVVEGIICDRSKLVIVSSAKCFKTWLTIYLALAVAHGVPFLGRATVRRKVLYVNLELKAATFNRRLKAIANALGITVDPGWFHHLPLRGCMAGITVDELISRIVSIAKQLKIGMAVIDPVAKANVEGEENSSRDQTLFFNQIDRLTTEADCTVVLNDHTTKGNQSEKDPLDTIRGSSAKGGDLDAAMVLRKHEVEGCYRVDMVHRELAPVDPFVIGWNYPLMELRHDLDPDAMKKAGAGRKPEHDPRKLVAAIVDRTA
ncbi:MAG: AAA family ATPase, partial [Verrucomicrobia bacterium]|nr:AAA family ATPase [Verrucomicrobiota bacterium]